MQKLVKCYIWSMVFYGVETLTLSLLRMFRKFSSWIYAPTPHTCCSYLLVLHLAIQHETETRNEVCKNDYELHEFPVMEEHEHSYNESQRDALFLNFILVKKSTCFIQIYCLSSGVLILYSQQLVFIIPVMLTFC
jgi:hypothetical protein